MNGFNRIVATLLWLALLAGLLVAAIAPLQSIAWLHANLTELAAWLTGVQTANPVYFVVGQAAVGIGAILILGALLFFEVATMRRRGVRIRTIEGGSAELDTVSVARRLGGHQTRDRDGARHRYSVQDRRSGGRDARHHRARVGAAARQARCADSLRPLRARMERLTLL